MTEATSEQAVVVMRSPFALDFSGTVELAANDGLVLSCHIIAGPNTVFLTEEGWCRLAAFVRDVEAKRAAIRVPPAGHEVPR